MRGSGGYKSSSQVQSSYLYFGGEGRGNQLLVVMRKDRLRGYIVNVYSDWGRGNVGNMDMKRNEMSELTIHRADISARRAGSSFPGAP